MMNEKLEKAKKQLNQVGHTIDDQVEKNAMKHNMPKWRVWFWYGVAAVAVVGAAKLLGWL